MNRFSIFVGQEQRELEKKVLWKKDTCITVGEANGGDYSISICVMVFIVTEIDLHISTSEPTTPSHRKEASHGKEEYRGNSSSEI